jgi:hypothetical protein
MSRLDGASLLDFSENRKHHRLIKLGDRQCADPRKYLLLEA